MGIRDAESVLSDPAASEWLKDALRSALVRDPVDAANDAEVLAAVLEARTYSPSIRAKLQRVAELMREATPLRGRRG